MKCKKCIEIADFFSAKIFFLDLKSDILFFYATSYLFGKTLVKGRQSLLCNVRFTFVQCKLVCELTAILLKH